MIVNENGTTCGLPSWIGIVRNDTAAYINDILLATVNVPCAIFAFLSNLAIIVTIIKKSSLQKPCNILLCCLAFADCLTGVTTQPIFVVWRFFLQTAQQSCLHQVLIFDVLIIFFGITVGLSFVNVLIISFDRHYALSRPLVYHVCFTKKDAMIVVILASIIWMPCPILLHFVLLYQLANYSHVIGFGFDLLFLVVPTVNYIRMLFAIRRHNRQLGDAVAPQQMSAVYQREKKVALDMFIVSILHLLAAPVLSMTVVKKRYPRVHSIVLPWCLTMAFIQSSIHPWIYVWRNKNLRNALKSMMTFN